MNKQNILVGVSVVAIILSLVAVNHSEKPGPAGRDGQDGSYLAGQPGPESASPYTVNNGVLREYRSEVFKTSTSTVASIKNPSASSTPTVIVTVLTATTTPYVLVLDESTSGYARAANAATSTGSYGATRNLAEWIVPAGTTPTFTFTATSTTSFPPTATKGNYLVLFADDGGLRFPEGVSSTGITGSVKVIYTGY